MFYPQLFGHSLKQFVTKLSTIVRQYLTGGSKNMVDMLKVSLYDNRGGFVWDWDAPGPA